MTTTEVPTEQASPKGRGITQLLLILLLIGAIYGIILVTAHAAYSRGYHADIKRQPVAPTAYLGACPVTTR
jgi:hypothetical protein